MILVVEVKESSASANLWFELVPTSDFYIANEFSCRKQFRRMGGTLGSNFRWRLRNLIKPSGGMDTRNYF